MTPCLYCTEKHVAKARVFFEEARSGYPGRIGMAVGELAAAEEEATTDVLIAIIRENRKYLEVERDRAQIDWESLLVTIEQAIEQDTAAPKRSVKDGKRGKEGKGARGARGDCIGCAKKRGGRDAPSIPAVRGAPPNPTTTTPPTEPPEPPPAAGTLVLVTALGNFVPSFSLVSVILDQARAAVMAGLRVIVVGMDHMAQRRPDIPGVEWQPLLPDVGWHEDDLDDQKVLQVRTAIQGYLEGFDGPVTVLTHDLLFQSWYINAAKAIHGLAGEAALAHVQWIHQVHSSVGPRPPEVLARWRARVPSGHRMAAVNWSDIPRLSAYYRNRPDEWVTIPNSCDPRTFMDLSPRVAELYQAADLARAEVIQTYPLSTPRAEAKGLVRVIRAFGELERRGVTTHLVVANAHGNGTDARALMQRIDLVAQEEAVPLTWISRQFPEIAADGLTRPEIGQLLALSNVFLFPSLSESCGLVMLEAGLAGNLLILNQQLHVCTDYIPHGLAHYVPWGSLHDPVSDAAPVAGQVADIVETEMRDGGRLNDARARIRRRWGLDGLSEVLFSLVTGPPASPVGTPDAPG